MQLQPEVSFLIVDDDEVSVMSMERAIRKLRLTNPIELAHDGRAALDLLRRNAADGRRAPFIILLDLNMPRMGGIEFLSEVREDAELHDCVVFVMTTSDAPDDIAAAYAHKVAGYIVKEDAVGSMRRAMEMLGVYTRIVRLPKVPREGSTASEPIQLRSTG